MLFIGTHSVTLAPCAFTAASALWEMILRLRAATARLSPREVNTVDHHDQVVALLAAA